MILILIRLEGRQIIDVVGDAGVPRSCGKSGIASICVIAGICGNAERMRRFSTKMQLHHCLRMHISYEQNAVRSSVLNLTNLCFESPRILMDLH